MRIFLAGASGAVGRRLTPMLIEAGHEVVGTTRHREKAAAISELGAEAVVLNAFDDKVVRQAVLAARPDIVIHELTSLTTFVNPKRMDKEFAETNKLRTTALDYLLAAAQEAGARRFIAQGHTGVTNERAGSAIKSETDPLDPQPPAAFRQSIAALRHVDSVVPNAPGLQGIVLRYGLLYGPGTSLGEGGDQVEMIRARKFPIVGGGTGIWSFIHVDDAASATVFALDRGAPGIYNIVDDDPAPVSEWLPYLAEVLHAKPPMRLPSWLARPAIGEQGVSLMTRVRGSSNAKAKRELGWQPCHSSWREGFRSDLA